METYLETDINICKIRQNIQVVDQVWKLIHKLAI